MSKWLTPEDILYRQCFLSCCGLYSRKLDGLWGSYTEEADQKFFSATNNIAAEISSFDQRTESNIRTLQLDTQRKCRMAIQTLLEKGFQVKVISGTRTYAEQAAIYKQGRYGNPGPIVANAPPGKSYHNFGLAWDIGLFNGGDYITQSPAYIKAGGFIHIDGVAWGGNWKSFKDYPHYQTPLGATTISQARAAFESGRR